METEARCLHANLTMRNMRNLAVYSERKHLDMVFSNRVAHEHGVEGGHFINTHAGHTNHLEQRLP